jgi:hypothetical protein
VTRRINQVALALLRRRMRQKATSTTTQRKTVTDPNFIPASDAAMLAQRAAAANHAAANLVQVLLLDLGPEAHQRIGALLAGGGRVGIEATVDGTGRSSLAMVGFTGEGARLLLLTVPLPAADARH